MMSEVTSAHTPPPGTVQQKPGYSLALLVGWTVGHQVGGGGGGDGGGGGLWVGGLRDSTPGFVAGVKNWGKKLG